MLCFKYGRKKANEEKEGVGPTEGPLAFAKGTCKIKEAHDTLGIRGMECLCYRSSDQLKYACMPCITHVTLKPQINKSTQEPLIGQEKTQKLIMGKKIIQHLWIMK